MRNSLGFFIFFAALLSCKTIRVDFTHPVEKIYTLPGPEDMVLDTLEGESRLIISCAARRKSEIKLTGIQFYNLKTSSITTTEILGLPDSIQFNPHGIDIGQYRSEKILWVINHEDDKNRQSVLRFKIGSNQLVFDTIITHKFIISPNDITDGGNGSFYLTNDASSRNSWLELIFKIKGGSILHYSPDNTFELFKRKFAYPNGIVKVNNRLYVSTTRENKIYEIILNERGEFMKDSVKCIVKGTGWDNFSVHGNYLLCTSHSSPMKFVGHVKKSSHKSPCNVYSIHAQGKTKGLVYHSDGDPISAASTAIFWDGYLFICQVFDPFVLKVNLHKY